ncbi:MAG: hypothetical protein ACXWTS_08705 [Methylococcaceae bacterium]
MENWFWADECLSIPLVPANVRLSSIATIREEKMNYDNPAVSAIKVKPWIGSEYEQPKIFPYKTLILGESNYTLEENFNENLVIECVKGHLDENDDPNFSRFATKTRRVIFGRDTNIEAITFWHEVAFYNFVQCLVGNEARVRPTQKMWQNSIPAFKELVSQIKPERILVLGLANWRNILFHINNQPINDFCTTFKFESVDIVAGYINHPSSNISYKQWHPLASELLLSERGL